MIDAGGRFATDAVPEYMVFEHEVNNAAEFLRIVEEGMEKSKRKYRTYSAPTLNSAGQIDEEDPSNPRILSKEVASVELDQNDEMDAEIDEDVFEEDEPEEEINLQEEVQILFKACKDKTVKASVRAKIKEYGSITKVPQDVLQSLYEELSE